VRVLAAIAASLVLSGCAQLGDGLGSGMLAGLVGAEPLSEELSKDPQKLVEYRAKEYAKDPRDLDKALTYAESLKAAGQKSQALAVLRQASLVHGTNRRLASDYGRLALELDQVGLAKRLLEAADDPANPDWRVILARGTVLAKEGKYREAIPFYERALVLAPDHPSVMNNLALAYTMSGEAAKAEELLRRAVAANGANAKVRQNLALVLGLQGKYAEATEAAATGDAQAAAANTDLLRKIVKADPQPAHSPYTSRGELANAAVAAAWSTEVAEAASAPSPALKASAIDKNDGRSNSEPAVVAARDPLVFKPSTQREGAR
jgi:Flp pilus assembly protein TadD